MTLKPRNRRRLLVGGLLFGIAATPSFAIFGVGDVVFDPTNYAQLIATGTTAYNNWKAFVANVQHFSFKQTWQTQLSQAKQLPFKDVFGETDGMQTAVTTNNAPAAQAAWQNATVPVNAGATAYLSNQNAGSAARSQLAMVEAVDATSPTCMNAVGAYRAAVAANAQAGSNLQSSQLDGTSATNSEVQQLNLVNAAQAQQLVELRQQGMLQACQAQQAAVSTMQQRNAAANDLNTWGFVAQQREMNDASPAGSSSTWTTYVP